MILYIISLKDIYKNKTNFFSSIQFICDFLMDKLIHEKCPHTYTSTTHRTEWFFHMAFMDTYLFTFNRTVFLSCLHSFHCSIL